MIIPTPEFDAMFADDGISFQSKMFRYIEREFPDLLVPHAGWLESVEGLERLTRILSGELACQQPEFPWADMERDLPNGTVSPAIGSLGAA